MLGSGGGGGGGSEGEEPPPPEFWHKCGHRIREWGRFDIAQHLCRIQFLTKCVDGVWN